MSLAACFTVDYPDFRLAADLNLPARGVSALFGPSGCGKTTLLRCLAGLEPRAKGNLTVDGEIWQDDARRLFLPPHRRALGVVFQEASLFPHLDVRGNLTYGYARTPPKQRRIDWQRAVDLCDVGPLLARRPEKLSGGERQRVALCRALLVSPRLLLMDEPLSALDARRKAEILPYLERLPRELEIPVIYVSHAMDEVIRLADHLVLMENGRTIAAGPLGETLTRLDLPEGFGDETGAVLAAEVGDIDHAHHLARLVFAGGELWVPTTGLRAGQATRLRIHARDVSIALSNHADSSIVNRLPAIIEAATPAPHPAHMLVRALVGETPFIARITRRSHDTLALRPGQAVWLQVKAVVLL